MAVTRRWRLEARPPFLHPRHHSLVLWGEGGGYVCTEGSPSVRTAFFASCLNLASRGRWVSGGRGGVWSLSLFGHLSVVC